MPDTRRRLYSEPEIRDILQRASALQEQAAVEPASGLSSDELERLAEEVGIDPRYIREAIAQGSQARVPKTKSGGLFGAPTELRVERVLDGEVSENEWEEIVAHLRQVYGGPGRAGKLGRTYEWSNKLPNTSDTIHVTLTPKSGQTRVRLVLPNGNTLGGFYGGGTPIAIFVAIMAGPIIGGSLQAPPIVSVMGAIVGFMAIMLIIRTVVSKLFAQREKSVGEVFAEIESLIEPEADPAFEEAAEAAPVASRVGVLDEELAGTARPEATARRKRTRRSR